MTGIMYTLKVVVCVTELYGNPVWLNICATAEYATLQFASEDQCERTGAIIGGMAKRQAILRFKGATDANPDWVCLIPDESQAAIVR